MGYLYRWIGIIILVSGIVLSFFLPLIFPYKDTGFNFEIIYLAYFAFLISSLIGYFINYRQNLLGADQKNYVITGYFQTTNIIKILIQMAVAYFTQSYYLWIIIELIFGIVYSILLNWKINRVYPWLKTEISRGRALLKIHNQVIVKTKQLFIQKISYFVQYQTVPFLTYAFVNLQLVAFYGNYTIITDKLGNFVNSFLESSGASIGNLIAEGNRTKIINLFWELLSMRYFIGGFFSFAILTLIDPFISIWLSPEYILSPTILYLICINVFIGYTRGGVMQFLFGYGMFKDIWAPILEIIINLSIAVIGGHYWGLPGILLGGLTSQILIVGIWKPIYLFKKGFEVPVQKYWWGVFQLLLSAIIPAVILITGLIPHININPFSGYNYWILYAFIVMSSYAIIAFSLFYICSLGMRRFVRRFINKTR